ncbi:MAG: hypothetical protein GQ531_06565 [Sulfurovum sp.]|nr:hypothetical protein [Sulfurovum sp.]
MDEINKILEKYNHFKDMQLRTVRNITESSKVLTIVEMDEEGEDLHTVRITFSDIKQSRILVDSVLSYMDTGFGVSIIKENGLYGFAVGSGTAMLHVLNAPMYIVSSEISIEEV